MTLREGLYGSRQMDKLFHKDFLSYACDHVVYLVFTGLFQASLFDYFFFQESNII